MSAVTHVSLAEYLEYVAPEGFDDELIEGEIVLSPSPKISHEDVCYRLAHLLDSCLESSDFIVRRDTSMALETYESMPGRMCLLSIVNVGNARDRSTPIRWAARSFLSRCFHPATGRASRRNRFRCISRRGRQRFGSYIRSGKRWWSMMAKASGSIA